MCPSPISAVIITKNEAENIARCIQAVQQVAQEVLVIDAFSEDKTVEIAIELGAKVLQKEWKGYGANKNYGNQSAQYDWILSIDADEVLSPDLIESLRKMPLETNTVYAVNLIMNYEGKWVRHSGWHPDWNVRLFNRKNAYWESNALVHESLCYPKNSPLIHLSGLLYHYSYKNSADHWQRIEKYAQLSAQQLIQQGKKATFIKLYLSPIARFFKTYFVKKGFLDGYLGWTISWRNAYLVWRKYRIVRKSLKGNKSI